MVKQFGIDGIYIIHAKKGYEMHEKRARQLFEKNDLEFEFVTDGDPSCFTDELLNKYFSDDIGQILKEGILSCTLNHILSYEKMVKHNNRYALVFENDPFFIGDFTKQIEKIAKEADSLPPGFIISLENTTLEFPRFKDLKPGRLLYPARAGRCAGAYLIDLEGAKKILEDLKTTKCKQVIDWWHNAMIDRGVIKMYWTHPPITEQGSHNGLLSSTISTQSKSVRRRISWLAQKYYKTYITHWFK
jgi:glycosyl transferase, family 25